MDDTRSPTPPAAPAGPPAPERDARRAGSGTRLLIGIAAAGVLTLVASVAGAWFLLKGDLGSGAGESATTGFLEIEIEPSLTDAPGDVGLALDPSDFPPLVTEVAEDIRRAADDPNVTGLYLEVNGVGGGWAATQEVRDAVVAFGKSGKPCHAWAESLDNKAYYLASACDNVWLAPAGIMLVNGFSVTNEYYAGTFEKIGVKANFEHVGDFKSAVEPFERDAPSEAASLATDELLDSLYGQFVAGIAAGRGMDEAAVRALVDDPSITPEAAIASGLVDGLKYRDEVRVDLAGEERITSRAYGPPAAAPFSSNRTLAVIHAEGQIISGESGSPVFGGSMLGDRTLVEQLDDAREDEDVVAVVLRVNSPGGSGLASDNIWHAVEKLKAAGKPIVVSMGDYAASGGYYISANADYIFAEPGTLTGSIGVFGGKMNIAGLYEKLGITMHTWQRGQLANLLSPTSDFSEPERAKFRTFLEAFYQTFLDRVAAGRKMSKDDVHLVAQGRVWTGQQALERKLVDELGGLDAAVAKARALASVPADETLDIERLPRRRTLVEQVLEDLEKGQTASPELMVPGVRESLANVEILGHVLADGGVAAMLPGRLEVR
jgi:protease-4